MRFCAISNLGKKHPADALRTYTCGDVDIVISPIAPGKRHTG